MDKPEFLPVVARTRSLSVDEADIVKRALRENPPLNDAILICMVQKILEIERTTNPNNREWIKKLEAAERALLSQGANPDETVGEGLRLEAMRIFFRNRAIAEAAGREVVAYVSSF